MLRNRKLGIIALLVVLAASAYLFRALVPEAIREYREAVALAPAWGWVYLAVVGSGALAFLLLCLWIVWTLVANTRGKAQRRQSQSRTPSAMSRREQQTEVEEHLAEGERLAADASLSPDIRDPIRRSLEALAAKRQSQRLEIVAFGTVSSGKSSLLNALAGRDAFRTDPKAGTTLARSDVPWPGGDQVVLVDTPGLAEVRGAAHEELAKRVARDADLILFVTDGPLRDFEHQFLRQLADMEKPVLLCLNKADWFAQDDQQRLVGQLAQQVAPWIESANIVLVRAAPAARIRTRVLADGTECEESTQIEPDITALAERMRKIVSRDGRDLLLANLLLQSRGLLADAKARVQGELDEKAERVVDRAMWQAGAAAALAPLPALDLAAGLGITSHMVFELAKVYRQKIDLDTVSRLMAELGKQLISIAGANLATPLAATALASLLKTVPGAGTLSGGLLQGLVQVLVTRWIGRVFIVYFRSEMQTPEFDWASLARAQWSEVTRPEELARLVKAGLARLGGKKA